MLNKFNYISKLEEINNATKLAWLKSKVSYHMSRSNSSYKAPNSVDQYSFISSNKFGIEQAVYHLRLFRAAVNRYIELKGSTKGLPSFANTTIFKVNINVDIETAYKIFNDYF